ncbi:MAG TPA: glycosyltransferase family 39 protein [Candidatus Binatia bacterium]|nr:glycosyltransferase family 39 protein [Candidatus Binatia bacterium]
MKHQTPQKPAIWNLKFPWSLEFGAWCFPLLLTLVSLSLFASKAFFIDDPLFLRVAQQIQKHPADFFGSTMNWGHTTTPMIDVFDNPPLACYYLAVVASVAGWSEPALHLAFLLPALAAVGGIFLLAKHHCERPGLAAVLVPASPVFLISATTVMCDVLMLAFWVWAVVAFEEGLGTSTSETRTPKPRNPNEIRNPKPEPTRPDACSSDFDLRPSFGLRNSAFGLPNHLCFLLSGVLAGLACLTKFPALALVPLLLAYGFIKQRRLGWWLIAPLLPLLFAGSYEWLTYHLYGHGHLLQAAAYSRKQTAGLNLGERLILGAGFAGGCFLPILLYAPLLWPRRVLLAGLILIPLGLLLLPLASTLAPLLHPKAGRNWWLALQETVFVLGGFQLLWLAAYDGWQRRDADALLLLLWTFGVFVFATFVNWTISGRSFLPLAPALGILVARRLENRESISHERTRRTQTGASFFSSLRSWCSFVAKYSHRRWLMFLPAFAGLLVTLLLVKADANEAKAQRDAALALCAKYQRAGRTVWFEGHWGFQYYMESRGASPLDMVHPEVKPGDIVVVPNSAPGVSRPDPNTVVLLEAVKYLPNTWGSTMNPSVGAGFYNVYRGPLPFAAGRIKPDYYFVFTPKPGTQ